MSPPILIDATDAQLTNAVHENLYALFRAMRVLPDYESFSTGRLNGHYASPPNAMFRGVWHSRLSLQDIDAAIDNAITWFEQRNAPDFFWWTDAQTMPADLNARLLQRGFDGNERGDPGMVADLSGLNEAVPRPDGLTIVRAVGRKTLKQWRDAFAAAYGAPVALGQAWVDATLAPGPAPAPWQMYVGYLRGKPVATSVLFNGAGVAGIYAVGTVPAARRQGIGAAMTLHPMHAACRIGYRYAVLFASAEGNSLYRRLGIREVNNRIGLYAWEYDV